MSEGTSSLPVEFLFRVEAEIGPRNLIEQGPQGTRAIVQLIDARFEGPRLRGSVEPPSGDWLTMRADGSYKLDVRMTLRTDDGALILMTYTAIGLPTDDGSKIRGAPLFETGDPRYAWLNRVQAVNVGGRVGRNRVAYDVYALL